MGALHGFWEAPVSGVRRGGGGLVPVLAFVGWGEGERQCREVSWAHGEQRALSPSSPALPPRARLHPQARRLDATSC